MGKVAVAIFCAVLAVDIGLIFYRIITDAQTEDFEGFFGLMMFARPILTAVAFLMSREGILKSLIIAVSYGIVAVVGHFVWDELSQKKERTSTPGASSTKTGTSSVYDLLDAAVDRSDEDAVLVYAEKVIDEGDIGYALVNLKVMAGRGYPRSQYLYAVGIARRAFELRKAQMFQSWEVMLEELNFALNLRLSNSAQQEEDADWNVMGELMCWYIIARNNATDKAAADEYRTEALLLGERIRCGKAIEELYPRLRECFDFCIENGIRLESIDDPDILRQIFDDAVEKEEEERTIYYGEKLWKTEPIHALVGIKKLAKKGYSSCRTLCIRWELGLAYTARVKKSYDPWGMYLNGLVEAYALLDDADPETYETFADLVETELMCWYAYAKKKSAGDADLEADYHTKTLRMWNKVRNNLKDEQRLHEAVEFVKDCGIQISC